MRLQGHGPRATARGTCPRQRRRFSHAGNGSLGHKHVGVGGRKVKRERQIGHMAVAGEIDRAGRRGWSRLVAPALCRAFTLLLTTGGTVQSLHHERDKAAYITYRYKVSSLKDDNVVHGLTYSLYFRYKLNGNGVASC